jgi:hypothetical protein
MQSLASRIAPSLLPLLLLGITSCQKPGENGSEKPRDSVSTARPQNADSASPVLPSLGDTTDLAKTIDTTAPKPLPQAPAELASDTIPLRAPDGAPARYGIRSGRVVLRFTGSSRGERTLTFDSYGLRERKEERTIPYPPGQSQGAINNLIFITTPDYGSYADVRTKMGWRRPNQGVSRYLASEESKTISLGELSMKNAGAERLPDTTISGYHCRVLRKQAQGTTITNWIWRGITIREQVVSATDKFSSTAQAVEIDANIDVPASTFEFPAGYKITEYTGK